MKYKKIYTINKNECIFFDMKIFDDIESAIKDLQDGKIIIVVDDENRENEGDMIMSAALATPEKVNKMVVEARGLLCAPAPQKWLEKLGIFAMTSKNRESLTTAFTVSVDGTKKHGVTTGISAWDRAKTLNLLSNENSDESDLAQPGHIFPLAAKEGGVLERAGHTEACVDLLKMTSLPPVGAICEIMNPDGTMARLPELIEFKKAHSMKLISIEDLIKYISEKQTLVECVNKANIKIKDKDFEILEFKNKLSSRTHYALTFGDFSSSNEEPVLVRVHAEDALDDVFCQKIDNSGAVLNDKALDEIIKAKKGVLIYISKPKNGISIKHGEALSTDTDPKEVGTGAQILKYLGVKNVTILSAKDSSNIKLAPYSIKINKVIKL